MPEKLYSVGDLDHRLEILRETETGRTAFNEPIITFPVFVTVWSKRIDASSGEAHRAKEVDAQITAHFVVRYSPETATINPKDRVRLEGGATYNITGVRELRRNEWLEIHAVARADK
jgi:head-tail adaptor